MRLIDADRLEKEMNDLCCGECEVCGLSDCPAHSQPTAYDVDKVVEQLDSYYEEEDEKGCYIPERIRVKVEDIVKAGEANENR